ncbi:MAG: molybdopterin-dependent oxidoreductase [Rhodospirillaceae bacterium]|nr:molybdopterin-dependent oxidoreductase [Rhodospirillaceae bacterium]
MPLDSAHPAAGAAAAPAAGAVATVRSACPHDCPSACALEVERLSPTRIGRIRGNKELPYTAGVVCEKVSRYAERVHHPDRLGRPLRRTGAKGEGEFTPVGWDDALDEIAEAFLRAEARHGSEAVWPYHSGGTLGIVNRWGLDRLRNAKRYSKQRSTICVGPSSSGWQAGVGMLTGPDPAEAAKSDLIVVWGGNPVATHVNLMSHIRRARKERGAELVVVDVYDTPTVQAADRALILRPGTDGALALAMMQVILAEGLADRDYLARLTDFDPDIERHILSRTPAWAAEITGLPEQDIIDFARLYGRTKRSFLRLGLGFTRARNGAVAMHAVSCLPALTGAWQEEGGGAFYARLEDWGLDLTLAHGLDLADPAIRSLDQSRIGPVLTGAPGALEGGPPVTAMLIQNANSAEVAPDSRAVRAGLARDDLFLCVHEQFMTATARYADIVLPATTFLECDDIYMGWGHSALTVGKRVLEPFAETRSNHDVVCGLAKRLGAESPAFAMSAWELVDATLQVSGKGGADAAADKGWIDCNHPFEDAHFLNGFPTADGKFHFRPDWAAIGPYHAGMPALPDHWAVTEAADDARPFRMVAPPARTFLNSSFTETAGSQRREGAPTVLILAADAAAHGIRDGARVRVGNDRGAVTLTARIADGLLPGTAIVEGIWPGDSHGDPAGDRMGINKLVSADPVGPVGGVAFHDTAVWIEPVEREAAGAA